MTDVVAHEVLCFGLGRLRWRFNLQITVQALADIVFIVVLMHASGGTYESTAASNASSVSAVSAVSAASNASNASDASNASSPASGTRAHSRPGAEFGSRAGCTALDARQRASAATV